MKASNSLRHGLCRSTIRRRIFGNTVDHFASWLCWFYVGLGEIHLWLWFGTIWWWFPSSQLPFLFLFLVPDPEHTCLLSLLFTCMNMNHMPRSSRYVDFCLLVGFFGWRKIQVYLSVDKTCSTQTHADAFLVGGFNPSENISQNWIISPGRGENNKYLKPPPRFCIHFQNQFQNHIPTQLSCVLHIFFTLNSLPFCCVFWLKPKTYQRISKKNNQPKKWFNKKTHKLRQKMSTEPTQNSSPKTSFISKCKELGAFTCEVLIKAVKRSRSWRWFVVKHLIRDWLTRDPYVFNNPIASMYGIFAYMYHTWMVIMGKNTCVIYMCCGQNDFSGHVSMNTLTANFRKKSGRVQGVEPLSRLPAFDCGAMWSPTAWFNIPKTWKHNIS